MPKRFNSNAVDHEQPALRRTLCSLYRSFWSKFFNHKIYLLVQDDLAKIQKKKEEEKALKELRAKAQQKGSFGGSGLKKSGKK
ncbi:hypothetical protein RJ639_037791 [Escallonia herrerae]|uniref:Uncharacterized protein n=1 Tax=Escallonia herrerae TaxID=1293975 RepID=A0AA88WK53_9ASTE|nr:hypothetical protein RJ639_037791 [Escallonia herrerae]